MTYTLEFVFEEGGLLSPEDFCLMYGMCSCTATYESASNEQVYAFYNQVTFFGQWEYTTGIGEPCHDDLQVVWWDSGSKTSYATFVFGDDLLTLDDWIQHEDVADNAPLDSPMDNGQWYITSMGASMDGYTAAHAETEYNNIKGFIPLSLYHNVDATFSE